MAHFIYFWTFLLNMFNFVHVTFFRFLFFRVTLCCYCCGIKLERKINNYCCCWCESLWVSYAFYGRRRHRCTSVSLSLFFLLKYPYGTWFLSLSRSWLRFFQDSSARTKNNNRDVYACVCTHALEIPGWENKYGDFISKKVRGWHTALLTLHWNEITLSSSSAAATATVTAKSLSPKRRLMLQL